MVWQCYNSLSLHLHKECLFETLLNRIKIEKGSCLIPSCLPSSVQYSSLLWWSFCLFCRKKLPSQVLVCFCHKCSWQFAISASLWIPANIPLCFSVTCFLANLKDKCIRPVTFFHFSSISMMLLIFPFCLWKLVLQLVVHKLQWILGCKMTEKSNDTNLLNFFSF